MPLARSLAILPRVLHLSAALLSLGAAGACYSYRRVAVPSQGQQLRVELTPEGTRALTHTLGPRITGVDGRLHGWAADSVMLVAVSAVRGADGGRQDWVGEAPVQIAPPHVHSLALRRLDRRRSWIVGGVTAAAVTAVGIVAVRGSRGKTGEPGNPPPPPPP